jgi:hypothetical protein
MEDAMFDSDSGNSDISNAGSIVEFQTMAYLQSIESWLESISSNLVQYAKVLEELRFFKNALATPVPSHAENSQELEEEEGTENL